MPMQKLLPMKTNVRIHIVNILEMVAIAVKSNTQIVENRIGKDVIIVQLF